MKRFLSLLCAFLALPLLFSCDAGSASDTDVTDTAGITDYSMTATVTELGEKILVEVTDSPVGMTGPYYINTDKSTAYRDADGNEIDRDDIEAGDTVVIYYSGQVMMSYPAQVSASRIVVK